MSSLRGWRPLKDQAFNALITNCLHRADKFECMKPGRYTMHFQLASSFTLKFLYFNISGTRNTLPTL
ncbi:hypothetical protein EUGRSUZ_E00631 [Eucalyptus grandis]|uniref:Uncharacterized protein n=2 Tax=Eucalyptus grandis TaxID=71139 RepID=A0ACC3KRZ6_EUCGR|nr:hypothetical protein EUGRSUZ_E00631 [Eucalyptus grandis]